MDNQKNIGEQKSNEEIPTHSVNVLESENVKSVKDNLSSTTRARVVVWEGEWTVLRLAARKLINTWTSLYEKLYATKTNAIETLETSKEKTKSTFNGAKKMTSTVYEDYPLVFVTAFGATFLFLTRRFSLMNRLRFTALGTATTSALVLYPKHVATLLSNPRQYFDPVLEKFWYEKNNDKSNEKI